MITLSFVITFSAITAPDYTLENYLIIEPERIIAFKISQLSSIVTFESIIQFFIITFFPIIHSDPIQVLFIIQPPSILHLAAIATFASS